MSTTYSLGVTIDAKFNHKTVEKILQAGLEHQLTYFKEADSVQDTLSPEQGANKLISVEEQLRDDGGARIFTKFEDTYFSLWIDTKDNGTAIHMGGFVYRWDKNFGNSDKTLYIDFMRYIRLLLALCKDYPITALETETD